MEALPLPPVCGCDHYTVRDRVPQSILPLFSTEEDGEKVLVVSNIYRLAGIERHSGGHAHK